MGDIVDISEKRPHTVSEVICLKCYKRWVAVRPAYTPLDTLECPCCVATGYVIETGQEFESLEGYDG